MKKGWLLEDQIWWYYWGKTKQQRSKGIVDNCFGCNKEFVRFSSRRNKSGKHFCSKKCSAEEYSSFNKNNKPEETPRWINGTTNVKNGYVGVYMAFHPNVVGGKYVREHRLVMEAYLNKVTLQDWISFGRNDNYPKNSRFLSKKELVHHKMV